MRKPFSGDYAISQHFGENPAIYSRFSLLGHNGTDWAIPSETPLYSCIEGTVTEVGNDPGGYGIYVKCENEQYGVLFAHLSRLNVGETQQVQEGTLLGFSDNTGFSTGPHLHLGIFTKPRQTGNGYNGYVDPEPLLEGGEMEEITELKRQIEVLQLRIRELETDGEMKQQRIEDRDKQINGLAEEIARVNNLLTEESGKRSVAEAEIVGLNTQVSDLQGQVTTVSSQVETMQKLLETKQKELELCKNELFDSEQTLKEMNAYTWKDFLIKGLKLLLKVR